MDKNLEKLKKSMDEVLFNDSIHEKMLKNKMLNEFRNRNAGYPKNQKRVFLNYLSYSVIGIIFICILAFTGQQVGIYDLGMQNSNTPNVVAQEETYKLKIELLNATVTNDVMPNNPDEKQPALKYDLEMKIENLNFDDIRETLLDIEPGDKLNPLIINNKRTENYYENTRSIYYDMDNAVILRVESYFEIIDGVSVTNALENAHDISINFQGSNALISQIKLKEQDLKIVDPAKEQPQKQYTFEIQNLSIKTGEVDGKPENENVIEYKFQLKDTSKDRYIHSKNEDNKMVVGLWAKDELSKYMVIDYTSSSENNSNMLTLFSNHNDSNDIHEFSFIYKIKDGIDPEEALKHAYDSNILIYIGNEFVQSNGLEHYINEN
ncbi:hypothetical protein V7147_14335 [Bacillus sp. JJ1521]|uniref:hypothetical protein n=1 Tax=Bacillus sp. JJ1521 TaxID=3122957 RepID=UPI003000953D